ncbi:MAG: hypothetical protein R6V40_04600 [Candidatus Moraniibacteriota bacterium]
MELEFQDLFNMIFFLAIGVVVLVYSYSAKIKKADKEQDRKLAGAETVIAGIILFILFSFILIGFLRKI